MNMKTKDLLGYILMYGFMLLAAFVVLYGFFIMLNDTFFVHPEEAKLCNSFCTEQGGFSNGYAICNCVIGKSIVKYHLINGAFYKEGA